MEHPLARSEGVARWLSWGRRGTAGAAIPMSLAFEGVTQRFGDVTALEDVTLAIAPGEIVALLGQSGCGKTTLLRLAAGVERPSAGKVLLEGQDVSAPDAFIEPEKTTGSRPACRKRSANRSRWDCHVVSNRMLACR